MSLEQFDNDIARINKEHDSFVTGVLITWMVAMLGLPILALVLKVCCD